MHLQDLKEMTKISLILSERFSVSHTHCARSTTRCKGVEADLGPVAGVVRAARCARRDVTRGDAATSATQFVDERDAVYSRRLCSSSPSCHRESWQFARWQFADWSARLSWRAIASFDSIFSRFFSRSVKKESDLKSRRYLEIPRQEEITLGSLDVANFLLNRRGWSSFRQIQRASERRLRDFREGARRRF